MGDGRFKGLQDLLKIFSNARRLLGQSAALVGEDSKGPGSSYYVHMYYCTVSFYSRAWPAMIPRSRLRAS